MIGVIVFGAMASRCSSSASRAGAVPDVHFTHSTKLEIVDGGAGRAAGRHGGAGDRQAHRDVRHPRTPDDRQGHRLPVDVEVRVPGRGRRFHQPPGPASDRLRQSGEVPPYDNAEQRNYLLDVDNVLAVLPADTKIRFVITADDVIHAWWVPALGWKKDAIPGIVNEPWTDTRARHLPRPVRRAVRQGPRLHADRGQGVPKADYAVARRAEGEEAPAQAPAPALRAHRCRSRPGAERQDPATAVAAPEQVPRNHKDIGTMYLVFSLRDVLHRRRDGDGHPRRAVPARPAVRRPEFFNSMTTMHALVMIFGAVMPAFVGLANWMIPLQVGAPDMALPRMNNFSFWILPFAFTLLLPHAVRAGRRAGRRLDAVSAAVAADRRRRSRWRSSPST